MIFAESPPGAALSATRSAVRPGGAQATPDPHRHALHFEHLSDDCRSPCWSTRAHGVRTRETMRNCARAVRSELRR